MSQQHQIQEIDFEGDWMILSVDGQVYRILIAQVSKRLATASDAERRMYRVSPSGYGIHWLAVDEDLSVNGLIQMAVETSNVYRTLG